MGLGDMSFRIQKSSALPDSIPGRRGSCRWTPQLTALMLVGGVLLLGAVAGLAKDRTPKSRTISGVVFDDTEAIIDGATVELTDLQTSKVVDIYSQEDGKYMFTGLRFDHDYTVKAMYKDSSSEARKISLFDTRWSLVFNLTIPKPKK